jgi:hypothetical protein
MESCDSVAVGVRLFEEMLGKEKEEVGGIVPFSFYERAACRIAEKIMSPTYFVFCTNYSEVEGKIKLPGRVHYVTRDGGYVGDRQCLYLLSRCHHHIISNSSFYWWGAWLAPNAQKLVVTPDRSVPES